MSWQYIVGTGLLTITVLAWLGRLGPLFEMLPNARSQMLIVSVVALIALIIAQAPGPAALVLVAIAINGYYVIPYYFASSSAPASAATHTVLQYNIFYNNPDSAAIANHVLIDDADIVVLHELLPEQWDAMEPALSEKYPHIIAEPFRADTGQLSGGMAILSKQPLTQLEVDADANPDDRVLLVAQSTLDGRDVTIVGLHPHASRFESRKIKLRDTQVNAVVAIAANSDGPIIVASDLNITPTSPTYSSFLDRTGWTDPHRSAGWHPTWPTWGSQLGFPIDHVFVSNEMKVIQYQTGDGAGSDHRSLLATITFVE